MEKGPLTRSKSRKRNRTNKTQNDEKDEKEEKEEKEDERFEFLEGLTFTKNGKYVIVDEKLLSKIGRAHV